MGSEGEREQRASAGVALDGHDISPTHEGRARNVATMVVTRSCMEATSWTRAAHWGILPSMWRAVKRSAWDAILGWLQAEFGHGPKSKVVAHIMLYNFYLRCTTIRAMD
jgi:hypothetical protein